MGSLIYMNTTHPAPAPAPAAKAPRISKAARDMVTDVSRIGAHAPTPEAKRRALRYEMVRLSLEAQRPATSVTAALCELRIDACRQALGYED